MQIYGPRPRSSEVCGHKPVYRPQTSNDRGRGPYICAIHSVTMVYILHNLFSQQSVHLHHHKALDRCNTAYHSHRVPPSISYHRSHTSHVPQTVSSINTHNNYV